MLEIILLVLLCFIPALLTLKKCEPPKNLEPQKAIAWLPLLAIIFSVAAGVFSYLQMRKMQKKNKQTANQLDGSIADEGVSFCDIAGSPHMYGNIVDIWGKRTVAIKQKGGKK